MGPGGNGNGLIPEGVAFEIKNSIQSRLRIVTPGYFDAMAIPVTRGRPVRAEDRRGSLKVMVLSESAARAVFGNKDPIGRRVACCEPGPDGKSPDYKTVVGVAGDVRWRGPGEPPSPEFYLPAAQVPAESWNWIQRTWTSWSGLRASPAALPMRCAARSRQSFLACRCSTSGAWRIASAQRCRPRASTRCC